MKLLPSIASADQSNLERAVQSLKGWEYLHIDIEDGNFVPNITFGMKTASAVCRMAAGKHIDAHLLVTEPVQYLEPLASFGVKAVCAHIESMRYPLVFLHQARALGMKAGLALNIGTPSSAIEPFWDSMDYVLCMTSEPDGADQSLYPSALRRVCQLAQSARIPVYADGGLGEDALRELSSAGAAAAVLGRLAFSAADPFAQLCRLSQELNIE